MQRSTIGLVTAGLAAVALTAVAVVGHAELTRQSMLDATLDFFAWTGLTPQPLVLVVFCSLLLSTIATVTLGCSAVVWLSRWAQMGREETNRKVAFSAIGIAAILVASVFTSLELNRLVPWWSFILYVVAIVWVAWRHLRSETPLVRLLRIRSLLITILGAAVLLYPLVYAGMAEQRRLRVLDVADDFAARGDAQAIIAAGVALENLRDSDAVLEITGRKPLLPDEDVLEQLARAHPIVDLVPGIQRARVIIHDRSGRFIAGYEQDRRNTFLPVTEVPEPLIVTAALDTTAEPSMVQAISNPRSRETIVYKGVTKVLDDARRLAGWITMALERRNVQTPFGSLFGYQDWRRTLSLAEFKDGRRVRSEGENFERFILPADVEAEIIQTPEIWRDEEVYSSAYLTYYRRLSARDMQSASSRTVVAVRARAIIPYDHLYYLLRIALAGLWIGIPAFLIGLVARWRMGLIPARRSQYGDRVLDAFLIVGTLAVAGMGMVGQQVITRENDGAIKSRLQRRLQRVEDALLRAAGPNEALYEVQRRTPIDSLAEQLSLDLAVYHGPWLVETSTPVSDAGPLMGYRLPPEAYDELFIRRFRQAFVESSGRYGDTYTIGYKALEDVDGWPQSVIAVLTFPEQARIREERARTTAYFFGALLLLLLVIMATATTLARALTGPLRRLRDGMQSVAAGRVQRPIPVESGDEVGQLVESFNSMQEQLSESRRKLAQQERELAWREMARQVAHEIKNPLTPMKLSIQHLQRAYEEFDRGNSPERGQFRTAFDRITRTVSEQIDTLAHIANEFSTFARMPKRHLEMIDPNQIIREAVELTGAELKSGIVFDETADPVLVIADRDELRRIYINLIKNAVQATDVEGTVVVATKRVIGIGDRPDLKAVLCEVTDDGAGIEEEVQERIFQPNFSTKTSGMGLGLAISKKSVEAMDGEIGFSTELGKGSTFWIKLPLVDA